MIKGNKNFKAFYSFKDFIMYFKISLNYKFDFKKSGKFSQLDMWQPCY